MKKFIYLLCVCTTVLFSCGGTGQADAYLIVNKIETNGKTENGNPPEFFYSVYFTSSKGEVVLLTNEHYRNGDTLFTRDIIERRLKPQKSVLDSINKNSAQKDRAIDSLKNLLQDKDIVIKYLKGGS